MTGNNVLTLNEATMQEAIEYWLNEVALKKPVTVVSIKSDKGNGYGGVTFLVEFYETDEKGSNE